MKSTDSPAPRKMGLARRTLLHLRKKLSSVRGESVAVLAASGAPQQERTILGDGPVATIMGSKAAQSPVAVRPALGFFRQYRDQEHDILACGMERLCEDMNVDPCNVRMLALAWRLNAAEMCRFSEQEFVNACEELCVYSAEDLSKQLDAILYEARRHFKDFYRFTFRFGLNEGQRCLAADIAAQLWSLVLPVCSGDGERFMNDWLEFLTSTGVRVINKDCWMVFLEFSQTVETDFSNYFADDSWPTLIDDFVEHRRKSLQ